MVDGLRLSDNRWRGQPAVVPCRQRRRCRHVRIVPVPILISLPILVGHGGENRHPDDLHAVNEEKLEVRGDDAAEGEAVDQRPEAPAGGQRRPRRSLHLLPHLPPHAYREQTATTRWTAAGQVN